MPDSQTWTSNSTAFNIIEFPTPTFTTPCFDYSTHSTQITHQVDAVYLYKNKFWSMLSESQLSAISDPSSFKESLLASAVQSVVQVLNNLTISPLKKRAQSIQVHSNTISDPISTSSSHSFDSTLSQQQKAFYHYQRGRLFNVFESYNQQAETDLTRAVKLDPENIDAWNALADLFWKKGDKKMSRSCLENGLSITKNVKGLIMVSMFERFNIDNDSKIQKSIGLIKDALLLKVDDHEAWLGLGNAYMKNFFSVSRDPEQLELALKSFNRAEACQIEYKDPDIYNSRAHIYRYKELYLECFNDFHCAWRNDPAGGYKKLSNEIWNNLSTCFKEYVKLKANQLVFKYTLEIGGKIKNVAIDDLYIGVNKDSVLSLQVISQVFTQSIYSYLNINLDRFYVLIKTIRYLD